MLFKKKSHLYLDILILKIQIFLNIVLRIMSVHYRISVYTSDKVSAGTDANVFIQIYGKRLDTGIQIRCSTCCDLAEILSPWHRMHWYSDALSNQRDEVSTSAQSSASGRLRSHH